MSRLIVVNPGRNGYLLSKLPIGLLEDGAAGGMISDGLNGGT